MYVQIIGPEVHCSIRLHIPPKPIMLTLIVNPDGDLALKMSQGREVLLLILQTGRQ